MFCGEWVTGSQAASLTAFTVEDSDWHPTTRVQNLNEWQNHRCQCGCPFPDGPYSLSHLNAVGHARVPLNDCLWGDLSFKRALLSYTLHAIKFARIKHII